MARPESNKIRTKEIELAVTPAMERERLSGAPDMSGKKRLDSDLEGSEVESLARWKV